MAYLRSGTIGSGSPLLAYDLYAEQVGGSGNSRTIKVTANFKVNGGSSSWYSYACNWRARVHNSYGSWSSIKGTESWNGGQGYRSYSQTLTVDVGTTNSTSIVVGIYTDSQISSGWDGDATATFTVGSTNVAPSISGTISTSQAGVIHEFAGELTITVPAGTDPNNNIAGYRMQVAINDGTYTTIYTGSSRTYTHNISAYGEGTKFQYRADVYDTEGAYSPEWVYSASLRKNTLTAGTMSTNEYFTYNTTKLNFNYGGGSNSNGWKVYYNLSSDIPVYNGDLLSEKETITVWKSGALPTSCYIKFDDLKNKFKNSNYEGNLNFTLTTRNDHGNSKRTSRAIWVDLRTLPAPPSSVTINKSGSTAYKRFGGSETYYFVPNKDRYIRVDWGAGTDFLGGAIKYRVQAKISNGSWVTLADNVTTRTYNYYLGAQVAKENITFRVITITTYGWEGLNMSETVDIHYYNSPSLIINDVSRTDTTATLDIVVKTKTSVPGIQIIGTWSGASNSGRLETLQNNQIISLTGLAYDKSYTVIVVYNDNTGWSKESSQNIDVRQNSPILSVTKIGVGVGAVADTNYRFKVNGNSQVNGNIDAKGGSFRLFDSPSSYARFGYEASTKDVYISNASNNWLRLKEDKTMTYGGNKIYASNNKPTPADIGAAPADHGHMSDSINTFTGATNFDCNTFLQNRLWTGAVAQAAGNRPRDWATVINFGAENNKNAQMSWNYDSGELDLKFRKKHDSGNKFGPWRTIFHSGALPTGVAGCGGTKPASDDALRVYVMPNGVKIFTNWYSIGANSSRTINYPSGTFKNYTAIPAITAYVENGDWQSYSYNNNVAVSGPATTSQFTMSNYDPNKKALAVVTVVGW